MRFRTFLILGWFSFAPLGLAQSASELVVAHITVIDGTGAPPKSDMTLVVTGNRITALGKTGTVKIPKGAHVVEGQGKYLIPGLWDMHVHVFNQVSRRPPNQWYFPLFITNGVTSVREMWTKPENMKTVSEWRQQVARGMLVGPRMAAVGTTLDGPRPKWPNTDTVATPEEARQMVRKIRAAGVDFVKVYDKLGREEYFAIADEAKKQGLPFAGHVPYAIDAGEASDAGQRSMEHLNMLLESCSTEEEQLQKSEETWNDENEKAMLDTFDGEKCRRLCAKLAANATWQVPTLVQQWRHFDADTNHVASDPRLLYVPAEEQETWKPYLVRQAKLMNGAKALMGREWEADLNLVREMRKAGVQFLAGTDLGNPYIFPGFSLHDELRLLVKAGLTPMEALQSATRNPAIFLWKLKELGTIQNGKIADLVLLDASPLEDIRNTQKIRAVIVNGRFLGRGELDKLLAQAEADAKKQ